MSKALSTNWMIGGQDQPVCEAFGLERARLRNFIRKRVADQDDAVELTEARTLQVALISFWQALGLLVPSKILFGGFRGRPGLHMRWLVA
jgi:hypothetical protein